MLGIHDLPLFIASGLLLNIAPGPDSLLVTTRGATQGWRAGSVAGFGISTGALVHIGASALGVSALLAASATAFTVLKFAGAAYLLYLGVALLLSRPARVAHAAPEATPRLSYRRLFMQGFLSNVLNPKVAMFFLAFVPQFIAPDAPNKALAFIVLGLVFSIGGTLWCQLLAAAAALASTRLRVPARVSLWLNRAVGALFMSLGIRLALARPL
jgi:threonine/homoserine/homoserine lactone efflux protein